MKRTILLAAALLLTVPTFAFAQAQTSLQSLRVRYSTRKATVQPTGEMKTQIDDVDRQLAEATRLGKFGEMRRLMAKGNVLLSGRPWSDVLDYTNSLVI